MVQIQLWERDRDLLPVKFAEEADLDCDLEVFADNLGPDVQGSNMRQQNADRTDVDPILDASLELRAFYLERLDRGLEVDKRLDGDGLIVQVQGANNLRQDGSIFSGSVEGGC